MTDNRPLGIFSYFGYIMPLAERIGLIAAAGFTHTSLWMGPPEELCEQGRADDMPSIVRDAGLTLENLHAPFDRCNDIWSDSEAVRQRMLIEHIEWLDYCSRHRIGCLVVHVTHFDDGPDPTPAGLEAFRRIVEEAEARGVVIAAENTRRQDHLDFLLANIDSPHLGLCYDSSHDWVFARERLGVLRRWGGRLVQTHLSDDDGKTDCHWLPGDGVLDWAGWAAAFPRTYRGAMMLELLLRHIPNMLPPAELLAESRRRLQWLAGLLQTTA